MKFKMIGGVRVGENQKMFYRTSGGGAWTGVKISDGGLATFPRVLYPIYNDNPIHDLLIHLSEWAAVVTAAIGGGFAGFSFALDTANAENGLIVFSRASIATNYLEISCYKDGIGDNPEDNSANVWGIIFPELAQVGTYKVALSGAGAVSRTSTRHHGFALYPRRYFVDDLTVRISRASQMRGMGGRVNTLRATRLKELHYRVRMTSSYPRALVANEFHALEDFLDQAATGLPVMIYPDRENESGLGGGACQPRTQALPYGWERGVLRWEDAAWEPQSEQDGWHFNWRKDLRFYRLEPLEGEG